MYNLLLYKTAILRSLISILEDEDIMVTTASAVDIEKILVSTDVEKLQKLSELKYMLAPLLCRNKEDQDKIYKAFAKLDEKVADSYIEYNPPGKKSDVSQIVVNGKKEKEKIDWNFYLKKVIAPVAIVLTMVAVALIFLKPPPPPIPIKKITIAANYRQTFLVGDTVVLTAIIDSSIANKNVSVLWKFPDTIINNQITVSKILNDTSLFVAEAILKNKNGVAIDSNTYSAQAGCEPPPSVVIDESDIATNNLKTSTSNKKQFEPLFINPSKDSAGYKYKWFVDDSLYSEEKIFRYSKPYNIIKLVVDCKGIHCSADSLVAQVESAPALNTTVTGTGNLKIQTAYNTKNILISLLLLLLLPVAVSFLLYRIILSIKTHIPEIKETMPGEEGPFKIEFTNQQQFINSEHGVKKLADVLRKRQVSDIYKLNLRKTIRSTVVAGGMPQLEFTPLSKPVSFLIFIDKGKQESHLVKLFEYLANELHKEQVDVFIYSYFKEPLFLSNEKLNQENIPLEKIAGLYPDSTLFIFGDAQYFLYPLKGKVKEWVTKKLSNWQTKILITPFVIDDWDKKEKLLIESNFAVLPADLSSADIIDKIVSRQIDITARKKQPVESSYRSRFINFQDFDALKNYLPENYLLQWVCSLAVYPEIDWNFTIAVGKAIEQQLQQTGNQVEIVNYTSLLKLSRISWMQDGIINESLRIKMLGYLDKDDEALARETLETQLQSIEHTISDESLVKERFDIHKKLNRFLLDVYHSRKTLKTDEGFIKRMSEKNQLDEAQDIYLNEGENKLLWNPAGKRKEVSLKDYFKLKSYKQKIVSGGFALLMLAALMIVGYNLLKNNSDFLKWSSAKPSKQNYTVSVIGNNLNKQVNLDLYYEPSHTKWRSQKINLASTNFSFKYDSVLINDTIDYGLVKLSTIEGQIIRQDSFKLNSSAYTININEGQKIPMMILCKNASSVVLANVIIENLPSNFNTTVELVNFADTIKTSVYYFSAQYRNDAASAASTLSAAFNNNIITPQQTDSLKYSTTAKVIMYINETAPCTPVALPTSVNEIWHGGTSNRLVNIDLKRKVIYYSTSDPKTYGSYSIYSVCLTKSGAYKIITKANGGFNIFFIKNVNSNSFDLSVCETIKNKTAQEIENMDEAYCDRFNTMTLYYETDKNKIFYPVNNNSPLVKSERDKLSSINTYLDIIITHYEGMHGNTSNLATNLISKNAFGISSGGLIRIVNPTPFQRDYDVIKTDVAKPNNQTPNQNNEYNQQSNAPVQQQQQTNAPPDNYNQTKTYTILWIDDNPKNNETLIQAFKKENINIITAIGIDEAKPLIQKGQKFDIVISNKITANSVVLGFDTKAFLNELKVQAPLIYYVDDNQVKQDAGMASKLGAVLVTANAEELQNEVYKLLSINKKAPAY